MELFKDRFKHRIFDKVYFGSNLFTGSASDVEIIENREQFIREYQIDSHIRVKRPMFSEKHLDHYESYKKLNGQIVIVTSLYKPTGAPHSFRKYKMMYHPNADTFVAVFDNKVAYNKWLKEVCK